MEAATMNVSAKRRLGPVSDKCAEVSTADSTDESEAGKVFLHGSVHGNYHPNTHDSSFHRSSFHKKKLPRKRS